jgi:hypothetical protein
MNCVWCPGAADSRFFANEHAGSRRRQGLGVCLKSKSMAMDMGPGGELRIDTRAAREVERLEGLAEEAIAVIEGKPRVSATEAGNEVVLEGVDGAFRGGAVMNMGRCKLEVNVVHSSHEEGLKGGGGFIVDTLQ